MFGTCCFDYDLPDNVTIPQQPICAPVETVMNIHSNKTFTNSDVSYRFVDFCIQQNDVSDVSYKLCNQPVDLVDFIPVVTREGDKVFKNKHCAKCSGYDDNLLWQLYLGKDCSDVMERTFKSIDDRDEFILRYCILSATPPKFLRSNLVECPNPETMFSKCNETAKWSKYEQDTEIKCLEPIPAFIANGYFSPLKRNTLLISKNAFCYNCNMPKSLNDLCMVADRIGRPLYSLFILIEHVEKGSVDESGGNCLSSEVRDPYMVSKRKCLN